MVQSVPIPPASVNAGPQVVSNIGINRRTFARIPTVFEMPNLVQVQINSFEWFKTEGLKELLSEISPITDYNQKMELHFLDHWFEEPRATEEICRQRDMTLRRTTVHSRATGHQGNGRTQGE